MRLSQHEPPASIMVAQTHVPFFPEAEIQRLICTKPWTLNPSQTLINALGVWDHTEVVSLSWAQTPALCLTEGSSPPPPESIRFILFTSSLPTVSHPPPPFDPSCRSAPPQVPSNMTAKGKRREKRDNLKALGQVTFTHTGKELNDVLLRRLGSVDSVWCFGFVLIWLVSFRSHPPSYAQV